MLEAQESSCHLIKWASDIKLQSGNGRIKLGDLFDSLKSWYVDQGILDIETSYVGMVKREKLEWLDDGSRFDPWIKASRTMREGLRKVFPKVRFSEKTKHGFFALGIQSINFSITPNSGSFDSPKEQNPDRETLLAGESKGEPNLFDSPCTFDSPESKVNQILGGEPNFGMGEPNKPYNHAIGGANTLGEPNLGIEKIKSLEIGDRVTIKAGGRAGKSGVVEQLVFETFRGSKIPNAVVNTDGQMLTIPVAHLEVTK